MQHAEMGEEEEGRAGRGERGGCYSLRQTLEESQSCLLLPLALDARPGDLSRSRSEVDKMMILVENGVGVVVSVTRMVSGGMIGGDGRFGRVMEVAAVEQVKVLSA